MFLMIKVVSYVPNRLVTKALIWHNDPRNTRHLNALNFIESNASFVESQCDITSGKKYLEFPIIN